MLGPQSGKCSAVSLCYLCIMHPKANKSGNTSKLRKGAWCSDEDTLLRNCIEKYGEGKWHLVPQRAGLNRCRKSCRLRWLNYLRPTIRRGEFGEDEVDLMIRLHNLLGNRWSLIAGRLPGRTANDVKNYWNTNLHKKLTTVSYQNDTVKKREFIQRKQADSNNTSVVIKPLPRTLSKGTRLSCYNLNSSYHVNSPLPGEIIHNNTSNHNNNNNNNNNRLIASQPLPTTLPSEQDSIEWWKNFLAEVEIGGQEEDSSDGLLMASASGLHSLDAERDLIWKTSDQLSVTTTEATGLLQDCQGGWSDIWDLLNSDYN